MRVDHVAPGRRAPDAAPAPAHARAAHPARRRRARARGDPGAGHELGRALAACAGPRPARATTCATALWQDRTLVKTWAMRGTLHLVAASEVPELVRGLGTRLGWQSAVWLRYFKVTKQEMVALQDAIGDLLSDEPMTRQELADALAAKLGDPAFAERVTSSWGTFLKPAAGRGYLAFGPDRGPERDVRAPGRVAGHRHPGARRRRLRCRARPPPGRVPGRVEGRARPVVGRRGEPGDRRVEAARRPARPRRPRGHEGVRARRGRRASLPPPSRSRTRPSASWAASTRTRCRSRRRPSRCCRSPGARSCRGPPAGSARSCCPAAPSRAPGPTRSKPKATTIELSPWRRLAKGERATIEAEAEAIGAFLAPGVDVRLTVNAPS